MLRIRNIRTQVLEWLGVQAEPSAAGRASRRERLKRFAWFIISTMAAFNFVMGWFLLLSTLFSWLPPNSLIPSLLLFSALMVIVFVVDFWIFAWGLRRFNLVVPWQFREAVLKDSEEVSNGV